MNSYIIPVTEKDPRGPEISNSWWGPCQDDTPRFESSSLGQICDEFAYSKNHITSMAFLKPFSIIHSADVQVLGIGNHFRGYQNGSCGHTLVLVFIETTFAIEANLHLPRGQLESRPFEKQGIGVFICAFRAETSFAAVYPRIYPGASSAVISRADFPITTTNSASKSLVLS
jgi:hypothetical protein